MKALTFRILHVRMSLVTPFAARTQESFHSKYLHMYLGTYMVRTWLAITNFKITASLRSIHLVAPGMNAFLVRFQVPTERPSQGALDAIDMGYDWWKYQCYAIISLSDSADPPFEVPTSNLTRPF